MEFRRYLDRADAGKELAKFLTHYARNDNTIILALPRGGVPIAYEVAKALQLPFYPYLVRKLGVPGHVELAMGAIATGGVAIFNQSVLSMLRIGQDEIDQVMAMEKKELERREKVYFAQKQLPSLKGKHIILLDDGIATGATMKAAITALRQAKVDAIIVAVPVCPDGAVEEFQAIADQFICPLIIEDFAAVGEWYQSFPAVEDETVIAMMRDTI
jgi:predicted phosphoribosyltransferase